MSDRLLFVLCILCFSTIVHAEKDPFYAKPTGAWVDSTGWRIVTVKHIEDTARWNKFQAALWECPPCIDMLRERNQMKTLFRIYFDRSSRWWTFAIDIPDGMGLIWDEKSTITMTGTIKDGSTVELDAEMVIFPIGLFPERAQHTELINIEKPVYVKNKKFGERSSTDFEWVRFRQEDRQGLPAAPYVLAYAKFMVDGLKGFKPDSWRPKGVVSYSY